MPKSICSWSSFMAAFLAVLLTSACANKQIHSENIEIDEILARGPSSDEGYSEEDEEAFQLMFQSERPEEALYVKFSQLEEAFYWAHVLTQKFDDLLIKASASNESSQQDFLKLAIAEGVYPRLIAIQKIAEETDTRLTYFVKRLLEISNDPTTDAVTKAKVEAAFSYMATYLAQSPYSLRLALSSWAQNLHDQYPDLPGFNKAYKRLFVGNYEGLYEFSDEPKVKNHLEYLSGKLANEFNYLHQRMEDMAQSLAPDLLADLEGERSPQSEATENLKKLPMGQFALIFEGPVQKAGSEAVISALKVRKTKAAFFVPANDESPALYRRLRDSGMTVGNGTVHRPQLPKTFNEEMIREVHKSNQVIQGATGLRPQLILLPFGAGKNSHRVQRVLKATKLKSISAQIPSFSWHDWNADRVANRVRMQMKMAKSGAVVLSPSIVSAHVSAKLIDKKDRATSFVDISEVLK